MWRLYSYKREGITFTISLNEKGELRCRWYRKLLSLNPRQSWKRCKEREWGLFITGLSCDEISPFLKYLGEGFRLPKVSEWRVLLRAEDELKGIKLKVGSSALPVQRFIEKELFPLAKEGLLELVEDNEGCIGRPYQGFHPNTWSPEDVRKINWDIARKLVGFRAVKEDLR